MQITDQGRVNEEFLSGQIFSEGLKNGYSYLPRIIIPGEVGGFSSIRAGLENHPHVILYDQILGQLEELVKLRKPQIQKFSSDEINELIQEHTIGLSLDDYGCWVFYPWSSRLIHLLPEDEFIEVRTNRNRNKITLEESAILSKKKVGVIGLSVGQSVSVTMAMERSFGEIRLADFDKLELTNLNRIRTGLHNLGLPKVISVAREIAEIDPFLKISIYPEGITEENIIDFLTEGGKLNALIDECDGLDIKVLCRIKARELGIPVLMEASDRGTIDVERFDLEPDRSILHGFIDHLDVSKIKDLETNEEKVPYLLPISGMETLSEKMRASMLEIGQSLTTWPQLSSAVTLGGGITADTYRRIMLGEFRNSGRYFVDLDELLPESDKTSGISSDYSRPDPLQISDMVGILEKLSANGQEGSSMNLETAGKLVSAAITAPSAGNNQPWKWVLKSGELFLFHDRHRSVSFSDFGDMGSMITFGACLENIVLEAGSMGLDLDLDLFPDPADKRLVASIRAKEGDASLAEPDKKLHDSIGLRQTNRHKNSSSGISAQELGELAEVMDGSDSLAFLTTVDKGDIRKMAQVVSACERIRIMHPMGHADFYKHEVRWSSEESEECGDGIDIATVDLNASEKAGMKLASDAKVVDLLRKWKGGKGFEKLSREAVENSPALGLIRVKGTSFEDIIQGGRMLQRIWLKATDMHIALHPVSASLFMFSRLIDGKGLDLSPAEVSELESLLSMYREVFPPKEAWKDLFIFRLFKSDEEVVRSFRLPIDEVFKVL